MVGYIGFDPGANSSVTRVRSTTSPTSPINHSDLDGSTSIYLPFDSDVNDDSSHGHTGDAFGDATISSTQSKFGGNSLYLDGSDVVRYSTDNAMKLSTEDFTIEAWVYRTSNVSYGTVAARWDVNGNNRSYIARFNNNVPYFYYSTNGTSYTDISFHPVELSLNTWHHVAWVRRNDHLYFYLDGEEASTVHNFSGANIYGATEAKFAVGAVNSTASGHLSAANFFAGYIDDLRVIKGKGLYTGDFTPPAAAVGVHNSYPVSLYLPFDSDIQDDSTHAHTVTASGDAAVSSAQSKFGGNSLALDGTGDYLSVSADTDFRTDDEFTLEGWARASSLSGFNTIIEQKSTDSTETFTLGIENNYLKATQITTEASDWLFDTSFTGNNQQYSGDKRSITGSSAGLASAVNDTFINLSVGETAYYVVEFTVQNLRNINSFSVGWSANPSGFTRNGQSIANPVPWGEFGSGTTIQIGLRPKPFLNTSRTFALGIKLTRNTSTTGSGEAYFFVNGADQTDSSTKTLSSAVANSFATNGFRFGAMVWDNNEWSIGPSGGTSGYLSSYATAMGGTPNLGVVATASSTSITQTSGKTISTDEWFHYALGFNDGNVEIFHDGVKVSSGSSPTSSSAKAITIGADSSGQNTFAGYLDDIRFSRVKRYTKNFVPPSAAVGATLNGTNETNTTTGFTSVYLPFDSDVNDDGPNSLSVTAAGGAGISSAQSKFGGNSALFDGTDDALVVSNAGDDFDFGTGDFTIELFFYQTSNSSRNDITGTYSGASTGWGISTNTSNTNEIQVYFGNSIILNSGANAYSLNTWHHLAVARSGSTIKMFIDGSAVASATNTTNVIGGNNLRVGAVSSSVDATFLFFSGYIDDYRILKGYAKYTTGFSPPSSAVGTSVSETHNDLAVLYMPFDGTTGSTSVASSLYLPFDSDLNDDSSNASTGTASGGAAISSTQSKFGGSSLYLDGSNDYVTYDNLALGTDDFTIEMFIYSTNSTGYREIVNNYHSSANGGWLLRLNNGGAGKLQFSWRKSNSWHSVTASGNPISQNTWHHIAAVRSGNTLTLYVDGVSIASGSISGFSGINTAIQLGTYSSGSGQWYRGYIDDLRIITGTALYTANFTVPTSAIGAAGTLVTVKGGLEDQARNHSVDTVGDVNLNTSIKQFGTSSAYFDGSGDGLTVATGAHDDFNLKDHDFTIELWAYLTSTATARLIHLGTVNSYVPILIQSHSGNFVFYASKGGAWSPVNNVSLGTVSLNTWTHLAVTREGNTFRCFQDGVLKSTTVVDYGVKLMDVPGDGITIGRYPSGIQSVPGYLDDIRIIKGKAIYTEAFTPPTEAVGAQVQGGGVTTTTRTVDKKNLGSIWTLNRGSGKTSGKSFLNQRRRGRWGRSRLKGVAGHRHYSQPSGNATGGDITVSGGIVRHVFSAPLTTNPGPIESSVDATGVFTMPGTLQNVDVTIEIVGGGGGGGSGPGQWGGSGAGGAYLRATYNGPFGSFPVTAGKQGLGHGRQHGQGHRASSGGSTTAFGFEVAGGSGGVGANPAGPPSRGIGGTVTDSSGIAGTTLVTSASGNDGVGSPGSTTGGTGGWSSSPYGAPVWGTAGAAPGSNYTRGNDATGYGNGGSSAGSAQDASSGTDRWAGDGSPGAVIISYPDAYRS